MATWTFSLDTIQADERQDAWIDVLARLHLPVADSTSIPASWGSVTVATAPLGSEFALMRASPQAFSGRSVDQDAGAWLIAVIEGQGALKGASGHQPVHPGALIVGSPGIDTTLRLDTDFRLLFIRFPRLAIGPRLVAPIGRRVEVIDTREGFGPMFFGFLTLLAEQIDHLSDAHLQPVEQSTIDLLVAMLASSGGAEARGGAAGARASHLHRLCQRIEALLPDPELSLVGIAAADGVSPRYLQKLFTAAGLRFSTYVRSRRLERCYADLASPIHAQLSISEICYRWGFSDAAHFSRVFKDRYGISPSARRAQTD